MARGIVSVNEAAASLGISPRRIRALVQAGKLEAERMGSGYLIDARSSARFKRSGRRNGRPFSDAGVWGLLALLDGHPEHVTSSRSTRYRLQHLLQVEPNALPKIMAGSQPRSSIHRWRVLDGDLKRLQVDPEVILTGLSANDPRIDIRHDVSRDGLDAYVSEHKLKLLRERLKAVEDSASPNLTLRVPRAADWVLLEENGRAPSVVVAADLIDDPDERVRRAARNLLLRITVAD